MCRIGLQKEQIFIASVMVVLAIGVDGLGWFRA